MTTFQAIVYAIVHGVTQIFPVSATAHEILISNFLGWPRPHGFLAGAFSLGALFSLFIYFIHDWASMISCFLQVILFRKKPMTLDERLPIFIFLSTLPVAAAWFYFHERIAGMEWQLIWTIAIFGLFGIPMWMTDSFGRKNKGMFDWTSADALLIGIFQIANLFPGTGQVGAALPAALMRNFNREAATKYILLCSAPLLAGSCFLHFQGFTFQNAAPMEGVSWLTFSVAFLVSAAASFLAIGGLMRHVQRRGFAQYAVYRLVIATLAGVALWLGWGFSG